MLPHYIIQASLAGDQPWPITIVVTKVTTQDMPFDHSNLVLVLLGLLAFLPIMFECTWLGCHGTSQVPGLGCHTFGGFRVHRSLPYYKYLPYKYLYDGDSMGPVGIESPN